MDIRVKFTGIDYHTGKRVKFLHTFVTDQEFHDIESTFMGITRSTSALEQADEWVSEVDKRELMYANDVSGIVNWEIISVGGQVATFPEAIQKVSKRDQVGSTLKLLVETQGIDPQILVDMMAVYTRLYPTIKNLSVRKQLEIVIGGVNIGYDSTLHALKNLNVDCGFSERPRLEE